MPWLGREAMAMFWATRRGVCLEAAVIVLQPNPTLERSVNGGFLLVFANIGGAVVARSAGTVGLNN
jgi:hypothetical protein